MKIYTKSQKAEMELDAYLHTMASAKLIFVITNYPKFQENPKPIVLLTMCSPLMLLSSCPFKTSTSPFRIWLFQWFTVISICQLRPVESNIFYGHLLPRTVSRAWVLSEHVQALVLCGILDSTLHSSGAVQLVKEYLTMSNALGILFH